MDEDGRRHGRERLSYQVGSYALSKPFKVRRIVWCLTSRSKYLGLTCMQSFRTSRSPMVVHQLLVCSRSRSCRSTCRLATTPCTMKPFQWVRKADLLVMALWLLLVRSRSFVSRSSCSLASTPCISAPLYWQRTQLAALASVPALAALVRSTRWFSITTCSQAPTPCISVPL